MPEYVCVRFFSLSLVGFVVHHYPRAQCVFHRPFIWITKKNQIANFFSSAAQHSDHQDKLHKIWHQLLRLALRYIYLWDWPTAGCSICFSFLWLLSLVYAATAESTGFRCERGKEVLYWISRVSRILPRLAKNCALTKRTECIKLIEAHLFDKFISIQWSLMDSLRLRLFIGQFTIWHSFANWKEWKIIGESNQI